MNRHEARLLVLAKQPIPGRVKTRLCPPCSHEEAAAIADAALRDTLSVVARTDADERILVIEGTFEATDQVTKTLPQRGDGLDERIANAFLDAGGPSLLIGMDTPQISSDLLHLATTSLAEPDTDAVLGPTEDGGYWAIGLRVPDPSLFLGVPMSTPVTFRRQFERLTSFGLNVRLLPTLVDIDHFEEAVGVAALIPSSDLAREVDRVSSRLGVMA